jgi:hypothetical protein
MGNGALSTTYWRGDGVWAPPAGGGDVIGPGIAVDGDVALFSGTTGKVLKTTGRQISTVGDVTGPAGGVTTGDLACFSGTTGKIIATPTAAQLTAELGPTIWSVRNNSYNSVGNPNFEVDQINCLAAVTNNTNVYPCDRWWISTTGTMRVSTQVTAGNVASPGLSNIISGKFLRTT